MDVHVDSRGGQYAAVLVQLNATDFSTTPNTQHPRLKTQHNEISSHIHKDLYLSSRSNFQS